MHVITGLANSIAHFFVKNGWGRDEKYEIYRYGCEVILSALITIILVAVCGLLFQMEGAAFLFYITFLILRRYCGGYHAGTYLKCNMIFTVTMLLVLFGIMQCEKIPILVLVITACFSFLVIATLSPITHKDKPLTESEAQLYRKIAISISGVLLSLVAFLLRIDRNIATIITLAMLVTASAMLVSVAMGRREKNER